MFVHKKKTLTSLVVIVVNCHLLDFNQGSWVLGSEIYFVYIVNKDAGTGVYFSITYGSVGVSILPVKGTVTSFLTLFSVQIITWAPYEQAKMVSQHF